MQKFELARELRSRHRRAGLTPEYILRTLSDEDVVESYYTLSCCGASLYTAEEAKRVIAEVSGEDEFLARIHRDSAARPIRCRCAPGRSVVDRLGEPMVDRPSGADRLAEAFFRGIARNKDEHRSALPSVGTWTEEQ
jgi:hypothetical protein